MKKGRPRGSGVPGTYRTVGLAKKHQSGAQILVDTRGKKKATKSRRGVGSAQSFSEIHPHRKKNGKTGRRFREREAEKQDGKGRTRKHNDHGMSRPSDPRKADAVKDQKRKKTLSENRKANR